MGDERTCLDCIAPLILVSIESTELLNLLKAGKFDKEKTTAIREKLGSLGEDINEVSLNCIQDGHDLFENSDALVVISKLSYEREPHPEVLQPIERNAAISAVDFIHNLVREIGINRGDLPLRGGLQRPCPD